MVTVGWRPSPSTPSLVDLGIAWRIAPRHGGRAAESYMGESRHKWFITFLARVPVLPSPRQSVPDVQSLEDNSRYRIC